MWEGLVAGFVANVLSDLVSQATDEPVKAAAKKIRGILSSNADQVSPKTQQLLKDLQFDSSYEQQELLKQSLFDDLEGNPQLSQQLWQVIQPLYVDQSVHQTTTVTNDDHSRNVYGHGKYYEIHHHGFEAACPHCGSIKTMKLAVFYNQAKEDQEVRVENARKRFEAKQREIAQEIRRNQILNSSIQVKNTLLDTECPRYIPKAYPEKILPLPDMTGKYAGIRIETNVNGVNIHPHLNTNIGMNGNGSPGNNTFPVINFDQPNYRITNPPRPTPYIAQPNISITPPSRIVTPPISIPVDPLPVSIDIKEEEISPEEKRKRALEAKVLALSPPTLKNSEDYGYRSRNFLQIMGVGCLGIGFTTFILIGNFSGSILVAILFSVLGGVLAKIWIMICKAWKRHHLQEKEKCEQLAEHYNTYDFPREHREWNHKFICKDCHNIFLVDRQPNFDG
jgi:hypothetical protein